MCKVPDEVKCSLSSTNDETPTRVLLRPRVNQKGTLYVIVSFKSLIRYVEPSKYHYQILTKYRRLERRFWSKTLITLSSNRKRKTYRRYRCSFIICVSSVTFFYTSQFTWTKLTLLSSYFDIYNTLHRWMWMSSVIFSSTKERIQNTG